MPKKHHLLLLLITLSHFFAIEPTFGDLASEQLGEFYVQIALMHDVLAKGIDEVFKVEMRYLHPSSESEVNLLKNFDYYDEGGVYRWRQTKGEWRLFKFEPGKIPIQIKLVGMMFPYSKRTKYHLQLYNANPQVYNNYNLEENLKYLGVMGIAAVGGTRTVDFINVYKPVNPDANLSMADVAISNVEVMLKRFAHRQQFEGLTLTTSEQAENNFTDENSFIDASEEVQKFWFKDKMVLFTEQEIIDQYVHVPGKGYLAPDPNNSQIFLKNLHRKIPFEVGDWVLDENPAESFRIKLIYKPIRAKTDTPYGSPKAAFIPAAYTEVVAGNATSYYPIFIFPAAFTNIYVFEKAILRELHHAQWWNAVANLESSVASAPTPDPLELREVLLRTALPYFELNIQHAVMLLSKDSFQADVNQYQHSAFYKAFDTLFYKAIETVDKNPISFDDSFRLPWTLDNSLIIPTEIHDAGDIFYNQVAHRRGRKVNREIATKVGFPVGWGAWLKQAFSGPAKDNISPGAYYFPIYSNWDDVTEAKLSEKKFYFKTLIKAVVHGFFKDLQVQNQNLASVIDNQVKPKVRELVRGEVDGSAAPNFALLDKVKQRGYGHSNFNWIHRMNGFLRFSSSFRGLLDKLASKYQFSELRNIYPPEAYSYFVNTTLNQDQFTQLFEQMYDHGSGYVRKWYQQKQIESAVSQYDTEAKAAKDAADQLQQIMGDLEAKEIEIENGWNSRQSIIDDRRTLQKDLMGKDVRKWLKCGPAMKKTDVDTCKQLVVDGKSLREQIKTKRAAEANVEKTIAKLLDEHADIIDQAEAITKVKETASEKFASVIRKGMQDMAWPTYAYYTFLEHVSKSPPDLYNLQQSLMFWPGDNGVGSHVQFIDVNGAPITILAPVAVDVAIPGRRDSTIQSDDDDIIDVIAVGVGHKHIVPP